MSRFARRVDGQRRRARRARALSSCRVMALVVTHADAGDAVQGREERAPAPALGVEDLLARGRQPVEAAPAHAGLLDPVALDQAAALEAVERRVQRRDVELQRAVGTAVDQLGDLVAVAVALLEQREDQGFGAALPQLAVGATYAGSIGVSHTYVNSMYEAGSRFAVRDRAGTCEQTCRCRVR